MFIKNIDSTGNGFRSKSKYLTQTHTNVNYCELILTDTDYYTHRVTDTRTRNTFGYMCMCLYTGVTDINNIKQIEDRLEIQSI